MGDFGGLRLLDLRWNPHWPDIFAFSGTGGSIFIWRCAPNSAIRSSSVAQQPTLTCVTSFRLSKDAHSIRWHPTTPEILVCVSAPDHRIVFYNAVTSTRIAVIETGSHGDFISGVAWSKDGRQLVTSCKDGFVRFFNTSGLSLGHGEERSLSVATQFRAHSARKSFEITLLKDGRVFTSGFTGTSMREIALWPDLMRGENRVETPLFRETVDHGVAGFQHHYDSELSLIYLSSKGENGFRVFEITDAPPYVHFLFRHATTSSTLATSDRMVSLPNSSLDNSNCEIQRFLHIDLQRKRFDQMSVRVPRRYPQSFISDIYSFETGNPKIRSCSSSFRTPLKLSGRPRMENDEVSNLHANVTVRRKSPIRVQPPESNLFENVSLTCR